MKHTITWEELGQVLSKAKILRPDEDIDQVTLTKPRSILLHTSRPETKHIEEE